MTWYHPKYYAELRKRAREQTAAWYKANNLQASSSKQQASSNKQTRTSSGSASLKHQATSLKR
jgi:hypothetical protein